MGSIESNHREREETMTYIITEPCVGLKDAACVDVCPVDCIYTREQDDQFFINPDECIDCGVCEPECPADAIRPDTDEDMIYYNSFKKTFGEDGNVFAIGLKDSSIFVLDKFINYIYKLDKASYSHIQDKSKYLKKIGYSGEYDIPEFIK